MVETKVSKDVYRFTVPAGGQALKIGPGPCPGPSSSFLLWSVVDDSTGALVQKGDCSAASLALAAGTYRLEVTPYNYMAGTYSLALQPAQVFPASLPLVVSNGTVNGAGAAGAGNLENSGAEDVYRFTVPAGGLDVGVGPGNCPSSLIDWELIDETSGATIRQEDGFCDFSRSGGCRKGRTGSWCGPSPGRRAPTRSRSSPCSCSPPHSRLSSAMAR